MYVVCRVREARKVAERVVEFALELDRNVEAVPGQFVMLWAPGVGEIPLSVADLEGRVMKLLVAKRGRVTTYLHENLREGHRAFLRGPYGRGFTLGESGRVLLVGGGYGAAPLLFAAKELAKRGVEVIAALGFKSSSDVLLLKEFETYCDEVYISTETGEVGRKGLVTDLVDELLSAKSVDKVLACGPEAMEYELVCKALKRGVRVEASLERLIKCGIGLCGSCVLEPLGLRVCKDGPVFDGGVLARLEDFGRYWRDRAGRRIPIE